MCHLWPYRAVERIDDFKLSFRLPSNVEVLAIVYQRNPMTRLQEQYEMVERMFKGENGGAPVSVVEQTQFGVSSDWK